MPEPPSSPPTATTPSEDALAYYKAQYEQLEHELAEFQASSQELEAELEKDVEAAEKRERVLREKTESLGFEVEEWKTKYRQSKAEANTAQNTLQKEITTLRESNRSMQLKLRDIEVANDDFERQARNTSSSLEDLESKFNVAIERAVMMEEEIKIGEQERESLRIETQRLRDELSDLKIEAGIMQDKLRKQSTTRSDLATDMNAPSTPAFDKSPSSIASSPLVTTPPDTKSVSTTDTISETPTPPSPSVSERSVMPRNLPIAKTPMHPPHRVRMISAEPISTPKARMSSSTSRTAPRVRNASTLSASTKATPSTVRTASNTSVAPRGLPNSTSLTHIRSLTAQMQRLEQRVQSARSKLPAPVNTPPHASPREATTAIPRTIVPSSVTIRSRKRTGGSVVSGVSSMAEDTPSTTPKHVSRISTSGISRLSFGPLPPRDGRDTSDSSRPSSRASAAGMSFVDRPGSRTELARPSSRSSMAGTRTPLGHYSQLSLAESRRPRSSIGGSYAAMHGGHGHSSSVSQIDIDKTKEIEFHTPSSSRRSIYGRPETDTSAMPSPSKLSRRQSGGFSLTARRTSSGLGREVEGVTSAGVRPPTHSRKLSGVGETF